MDERIVTNHELEVDTFEKSIRPDSFDEYIGQTDVKENIKVSGMLYISHYTGKKNIAIWDEHKFITFSEGKVVHVI